MRRATIGKDNVETLVDLTPDEVSVIETREAARVVAEPAKLEVQVQANVDDILQNNKKFRVMTELIFDTLKAGKTGDYSPFAGVTDEITFREHVVARFRALG